MRRVTARPSGKLDACTQAGLLRRIELAGHPARFERRVGDVVS